MEYTGTFENGVVRPDRPVNLANGTRVEFHAVAANGAGQSGAGSPAELRCRFEERKSVADLARDQGVRPIRSVDEFAGPWPDDDPADAPDELIKQLREWRR
jgi:hypothetical protein